MNKLVLPEQLCNSLNWTMELLGQRFRSSGLRIGGGSVLAARWNHRLSTDIDLFVDANPAGEFRKKDIDSFAEVRIELSSLVERRTVTELKLLDHGFSFASPFGPVSLYASRRFTRSILGQDRESSTGLDTESTREILFKKLYGRVIRSVTYVGRDMYDFIVAYMLDPNSLNQALNKLETFKALDYLRQDAEAGDIRATEFDRILEPRFPQLMSNINNFNELAAAVLSQEISEPLKEQLRFIRDSRLSD